MMLFVPRAKYWAVGLVACVVALNVPSVAMASVPRNGGRGTATASRPPKHHSPSATTRLPLVPPKAEPLLKRLLGAAGLVTEDDEKTEALSESYDREQYKLAKAELEVAVLSRRVKVSDLRLSGAGARLRQAAIVAYVTGELVDVNSGLLAGNVSQGEMANVYAGVALGELHQALGRYEKASVAGHAARAKALANSRQIARTLARVAVLRTGPGPSSARRRASMPRSAGDCSDS